jgi:hypothetical protein
MKTAKIFALLALTLGLFFSGPAPGDAQNRAGIDCDCPSTGSYRIAHQGVAPFLKEISETEGWSADQNPRYKVIVGIGNQIVLHVFRTSDNQELLNEAFTPTGGGAAWGFNADQHHFVYHYYGLNEHIVRLFDLENSGNKLIDDLRSSSSSSSVRFSASGRFLIYAALTTNPDQVTLNLADCETGDVFKDVFGLAPTPADKSNAQFSTA